MFRFDVMSSCFRANLMDDRKHFTSSFIRYLILFGSQFDRETVVIAGVQRVKRSTIDSLTRWPPP